MNLKNKLKKRPFGLRKIAIMLIRFYQQISLFFPDRCRYIPTCSAYAQEAFRTLSFLKAVKLTIFRLLRCNPFVKGGFDPVK